MSNDAKRLADNQNDRVPKPLVKKPWRGYENDITVVVGQGESEKAYEFNKTFLASASEIASMLVFRELDDKKTDTLRLPTLSPAQWEAFSPFISPPSNESKAQDPIVTEDNYEDLLPVFHFFQLHRRIEECEETMLSLVLEWEKDDDVTEIVSDTLDGLASVITLALRYDMRNLQNEALNTLFRRVHLNEDSVDIPLLKKLIRIGKTENRVWLFLRGYAPTSLRDGWNDLTKTDNPLLPHLLLSGLRARSFQSRSKQSARELRDTIQQLFPLKDNGDLWQMADSHVLALDTDPQSKNIIILP